MRREVAGVLLAGGEGIRFGAPKALVEFAGQPLVVRGAAILTEGGCRPVIVVLGAAASEVLQRRVLGEAVVVVNEQWQEGMGASLRAGLDEAERSGVGAALVMPVDQPVVTGALVARLIEAWRKGAAAAVATFAGQGLTPVVLDRSLWPAVAAVAVGEQGARSLLRSNPDLVTLVDCDDVGSPLDIDTPDDLESLERDLEKTIRRQTPHGDQL